jgi:hypothetical protein
MKRHVLLLAITLAIVVACSGPAPADDLIRIIGPLPYEGPGINLPPGLELLTGSSPSLSVGRPMKVMIEPWRPGPSDEVTVGISGWSSVPYLEAGSVDVDIDGNFITVDIDWISNPPAPVGLIITTQGECCSVGITHEEVPLPLTGNRGLNSYEIAQSLGTFAPGDYTVEVNSYCALTGTTTTTFTVREAGSSGPGLPDLWSFFHPDSVQVVGAN